MVDALTKAQRSALMQKIGSRNTKPEMVVRRALHGMGYRFRLHRSDLPGTPDIVLPKHRAVIFVHGCFWHGHDACDKGTRRPKTNEKFWEDKIRSNIERHDRVVKELVELGWQALTIWECEIRNLESVEVKLRDEIPYFETSID